MEETDTESLFYLGAGPLAAIFLGMALVPLRGVTTASNFAFAFMALTIAVAGFGGRKAAVATAIAASLSLDFFLTEPYQTLSIADKHDVIAFVGLTVCGLIAAALGSARGAKTAAAEHLDHLYSVLTELDAAEPVEPQLTSVLRAARDFIPLSAAVVRDERGQVVANATPADGMRPVPDRTLLPGVLPPTEGGRIALTAGDRRLGWLDVWGSGVEATAESGRALLAVARLAALLMARSSGGS
jgi:K+-sensing histidine kinase KdpD